MSTASQPSWEPLTLGTMLKGDSGRIYKVDQVLSDRRDPILLCVYRASAEGRNYVVKNMVPGEHEYQLDLQKQLSSCSNIRVVTDTIQKLDMFIYPFLTGNLLQMTLKPLSKNIRRDILRSALQDIKPNNILLDYEESAEGHTNIKSVQITDLDDAVIFPAGKQWLDGPLCGNAFWRSPESWCRSRQGYSSDVFSFGIMMIYVMIKEMVFRVSNEQLQAEDAWRHVLRLHLSYFADFDALNGFLDHIGKENPFFDRIISLVNTFTPPDAMQPFSLWKFVDPDLRDLVGKMTNFDPTKRITAREALQHSWFNQRE